MINLQGVDVDPHVSHAKVGRDSLRVGDAVGYRSRTHREVYGVVIRLNRKTATVRLAGGEQWGVPCNLLFYVIDAQKGTTAEALDCRIIDVGLEDDERPAIEERDCPPE